jgi:hypothetical protein
MTALGEKWNQCTVRGIEKGSRSVTPVTRELATVFVVWTLTLGCVPRRFAILHRLEGRL